MNCLRKPKCFMESLCCATHSSTALWEKAHETWSGSPAFKFPCEMCVLITLLQAVITQGLGGRRAERKMRFVLGEQSYQIIYTWHILKVMLDLYILITIKHFTHELPCFLGNFSFGNSNETKILFAVSRGAAKWEHSYYREHTSKLLIFYKFNKKHAYCNFICSFVLLRNT